MLSAHQKHFFCTEDEQGMIQLLQHAQVDVEELNTREEITFYMRDSLQYTEGHLDVRISLDVDLPWINQTDPAILTDPRFYQYLEILTSQYPLMK